MCTDLGKRKKGKLMKRKDIFLDFTSLLDVTLIIIFFFVIFSHIENLENTQKTEAAQKELEAATAETLLREQEASELADKLAQELELIQESDANNASILEALIEYSRGANLKFILEAEKLSWRLLVSRNNELVTVIEKTSDIEAEVYRMIQSLGYTKEDILLCDLVYNATEPGTASAYRVISKALQNVKHTYTKLFISETDVSVGEE